MNTFMKTQKKKQIGIDATIFNNPEQEEAAQRATTKAKKNKNKPTSDTVTSKEKITSMGVGKLFNSFRKKLPNSKVDAENFLPDHPQPVEQPKDETESNHKTRKLTYFQAQLKKYVSKSDSYKGQKQNLSEAEERKAIQFTIQLFICLTRFLAPALREFLTSKKLLPRNSTIDGYKYLKKMVQLCKQNINFLSPGGGNGLDLQYAMTALNGRSAVCHGVLPYILTDWHNFFDSWIQLCYLINAPEAANEIKFVHNTMTDEENQEH